MVDAIQVIRSLGFTHLWVDVLCIIQDSEMDWLHEASEMRSVYSNSSLTLAAADCEDHAQGMFRSRPVRCIRPVVLD
jgi:succinylarginine dihydrolase